MGLSKWLVLVVVVAACAGDDDSGGGGGGSPGTISGPINGRTLTVTSAISGNVDRVVSDVLHYGVVFLSDAPALCDVAAGEATPPVDAAFLAISATVLSTSNGNYVGALPTPGTYTVNSQTAGPIANAELNIGAGSCDVPSTDATSGTVTLTTAANGVYAGTFDLVFQSGDHVTGTFSPSACTELHQFQIGCTP